MKRKLSKLMLGGLIFLACYQTVNAQTIPRVEIENSELLTFTSKTVDGQEYRLFINVPGSYKTNPTKIYSVIYLTDAQSTFTSFKGIYSNLKYDGFIPESVTVGITWGGINPNISALRARDFLTTTSADPAANGGAKFLAFIKNELIPFIKSKYRVNDDRTLIGNSFGGFFTLYALFNDPALFNRYIVSSPTLTFDNSILRSMETKYAAVGSPQPTRIFMGKGSVQDGSPTEFADLTERLKKVKNLEVKAMEIVDMGHASNTAETYSRGLLWVFKTPIINVAPDILKKYVGMYKSGNETVQIAIKNDNLLALINSRDIVLQAESKNSFHDETNSLKATFLLDDNSNVKGLNIELRGGIQLTYQPIK